MFWIASGTLKALPGWTLGLSGFPGPSCLVCNWLSMADFQLVRETFLSLCTHQSLQATTAEPFSQGGWPKAQASQGIQDVREVFPLLRQAAQLAYITEPKEGN